GDLPEDAVYLGRSASHAPQHSQFVDPDEDHVEIILLVADSDTKAPWWQDPQVAGSAVEDPSEISWLGVSDIAAALSDRRVGSVVSALAISKWQRATGYCRRCGMRT